MTKDFKLDIIQKMINYIHFYLKRVMDNDAANLTRLLKMVLDVFLIIMIPISDINGYPIGFTAEVLIQKLI